jgi:hypothetical protein
MTALKATIRRTRPTQALTLTAIALALAACGGGSGSPEAERPTDGATVLSGLVVSSLSDPAPIAAAAVSPYVAGARVFLDLNRNMSLDEGEPESDPTGTDGRFTLRVDASMPQASIDNALLVARSADAAALPVPLVAPASAFRNSSTERRAIGDLSTMVASQLLQEPDLTIDQAVARVRESLPGLQGRDLFSDPAAAPPNDELRKAARLIAAQVKVQREERLQAVARALAAEARQPDDAPVGVEPPGGLVDSSAPAPSDQEIVQQRTELEKAADSLDPRELIAQLGKDIEIVKRVAQTQPVIEADPAQLKKSLAEAREALAEERRAEIESRKASAQSPGQIRADDEPAPDPAELGRRAAADRDLQRNRQQVTLIVVFKRDPGRLARERRDDAIASDQTLRSALRWTFERAIEGFTVTLPEDRVEAFIDRMLTNPNVDRVEIDQPVRRTVDNPQSPVASWGLDRSDARGVNGEARLNNSYGWSASGAGITAYIVDTGITRNVAFATGQVLDGFTSIADGQGWNDCNGHGTHVAGTVASPTYGIAKDAQLVPVRVLDCNGGGSTATVVAGLDWVLQQVGTDPQKAARAVVNLSLGGGASSTLDQAVNRLIDSGVTVVVAAGNSADNACNYSPARVSRAITVAASDWNDVRASFSNFGSCVDLFAPGLSITSASRSGIDWTISGTSMAAPHVTGAIAQWLQVMPGATPDTVTAALLSATTQGLVSDELGSPDRLLYSAAATTGVPGDGGDSGGGGSTPSPIAVSVGSLTGTAIRVTRNGNWRASVEVLIRDGAGHAVSGATVTGSFVPGGTGLICVTASNGRCTIASGTLSRKTAQTDFSVASVAGQGLQYAPGGNQLSTLRISAPR